MTVLYLGIKAFASLVHRHLLYSTIPVLNTVLLVFLKTSVQAYVSLARWDAVTVRLEYVWFVQMDYLWSDKHQNRLVKKNFSIRDTASITLFAQMAHS